MITKYTTKLLIVCVLLLSAMLSVKAQDTSKTTVTREQAKKWLKGRSWANGITLKPHASVNAAEFYRQYHAAQSTWDKAFQFIKEHDLATLAPGKYPIDGDKAYASITEAPSKELDKANWESHKNYIDLQYVITGKEQIGVEEVAKATITNAYDATKDVANYTVEGKYYTAKPGTFFLFFPQDAHRPNIKVDGFDTVKKLVIKIKVVN
jgi:biofilm protein TabA